MILRETNNLQLNMTSEEALRYHAKQYPAMRPSDAVKLLYQNEFGGGHLIENPARSLAWIKKEYAEISHDRAQPLTVPIGNGIVRYNLHALDPDVMPLNRLNEIFVESSRIVLGNRESFLVKLKILVELTENGLFGFASDALDEYLSEYKRQDYPPVSHSQEFREAYRPAYRVILEELI